MAKTPRSQIQIEWFNVTYRSVFSVAALLVLAAAAAAGYWYYFYIYAPRDSAADAIERAESRFVEASSLGDDPRSTEILKTAEITLREATSSFVAGEYDNARVAAIRSENLSLKILRMAAGQEGDARIVRFYRIEGDVRVKRAGEFSWEPANGKMVLGLGDQVKTASSSSAQLFYFDGTITTIQPGSLLEIRELYENPVTKVRRVREQLNRGELEASTQDRNVDGSFHEVTTGSAAAKSEEAGEFRVAYDEQKKTAQFDVFNGRIEVASAKRRESLVAGEAIRSSGSGDLSAKQVLPGVPQLLSPRDQRVFIAERPMDETIELTWDRVAGADRYQLVISDKPLFTETLYDAERSGTSASLEGVAEGNYFWKVAAISGAGSRGPFSNHRRFRVSSQKIRDRADSQPPVLEITEFVHIGLMVIVNGRTEPGATLWADEEKIDVDEAGSFYSVVRLRKEGVNRLRFVAQDTAGNETEVVRSVYVEPL